MSTNSTEVQLGLTIKEITEVKASGELSETAEENEIFSYYQLVDALVFLFFPLCKILLLLCHSTQDDIPCINEKEKEEKRDEPQEKEAMDTKQEMVGLVNATLNECIYYLEKGIKSTPNKSINWTGTKLKKRKNYIIFLFHSNLLSFLFKKKKKKMESEWTNKVKAVRESVTKLIQFSRQKKQGNEASIESQNKAFRDKFGFFFFFTYLCSLFFFFFEKYVHFLKNFFFRKKENMHKKKKKYSYILLVCVYVYTYIYAYTNKYQKIEEMKVSKQMRKQQASTSSEKDDVNKMEGGRTGLSRWSTVSHDYTKVDQRFEVAQQLLECRTKNDFRKWFFQRQQYDYHDQHKCRKVIEQIVSGQDTLATNLLMVEWGQCVVYIHFTHTETKKQKQK
ncbi:hypothetical protein RFI_03412 [Reticulomyxa filosa]|uniref:Uncharacterized protein n=1 Tax=Reticulomyxa filosa TaxID=46433 RepID=X6P6F2_RETFI|nr:hypothetical protein RFI_03412 [Reticulomyxa filosa]|eukprot:ETO33693.1 hypothetical protein RFI_03412 [Reticulomyxa filosa]